ncbi:hypothetical protein [Bradyrhizobium sp. P5_C11_2]
MALDIRAEHRGIANSGPTVIDENGEEPGPVRRGRRTPCSSPVEALRKLREEMVTDRRKLVDQRESIQNVQAEIEAINRAIADEEAMQSRADPNSRWNDTNQS